MFHTPFFNKCLLLLCFCSLTVCLAAQDKVTLSGYIRDAANGEALIGASVYIKELQTGSASNVYGFYSLTVAPGSYTLEYSYLGFDQLSKTLNLDRNQKLDVELAEEVAQLEEVVVVAKSEDANVSGIEMSTNKLDIQTIQNMPALLGEVDVIRSIQLLPGVSSVGEGTPGFNVRGGSVDQNLVLLDEAPVYNSSHLFGFFSVFNPDAVKDVKLYKGGIPAQYGGRLSSILDVRMKEGNSKRFSGQGGVGLIFSRLTLEAPIVKEKASFIAAVRRSYADVLAKPFLKGDLKNSKLNFYDLTLKTNYNINEKNRIFLSGYLGRDVFQFGDEAGFNWGNATTTLRWNHLFSDRLFSNFTAFYSNYDYLLKFGEEDTNRFDWDAKIINYSLEPEFTFFINPDNILTFGGQGILYEFQPGNAVGVSEGEVADVSLDKKYAFEGALFVGNEQSINSRLSLQYGLRWSYFNYMGKGRAYEFGSAPAGQRRLPTGFSEYDQWESIETFSKLEPRFSTKFQIDGRSSLKASYMRTAQYLHLISNGVAATPLDVWTPSTHNIAPQTAHQLALGYFQNFSNNRFESSLEVYYKNMDDLVDYIDGADLLLNEFLEGDLLSGKGRAYGAELMVSKKKGRLHGWLSYTLARSERHIVGINGGDWYPSRFDQTHNLSITSFYDLNDRWTFSANFTFISGTPTNFPTNRIELQGYVIPHNSEGQRNNVRIPAYHRLDVSARLNNRPKEGKRWESYWIFGVYNVYNRRNPFSIYFRQQQQRPAADQPVDTEGVRFSVIGNFIPAVSYNFKF